MEIIGYSVKSELHETLVSEDGIREAIVKHALPEDLLMTPRKKGAIIRAVKEVAKTNRRFKDKIARRVKDDETFVVSIVDEEKDKEHETLHYHQTTTVRLKKEKDEVTADGPLADEFWSAFEKYYNGATTNDIRAYLYRVLREHASAVAIIPTGGLYFVPDRSIADKLNLFLNDLGIGRMWIKPEVDSTETQEWVWQSAVHESRKTVEDIMAYIKRGATIREKTLRDRQEEVHERKRILEKYRKLCEIGAGYEKDMEFINEAIDEMTVLIKEC